MGVKLSLMASICAGMDGDAAGETLGAGGAAGMAQAFLVAEIDVERLDGLHIGGMGGEQGERAGDAVGEGPAAGARPGWWRRRSRR